MNKKLKCCPFCNSDNVLSCKDDCGYYFILCTNCETQGPTKDTKEESIKYWNVRTIENKVIT